MSSKPRYIFHQARLHFFFHEYIYILILYTQKRACMLFSHINSNIIFIQIIKGALGQQYLTATRIISVT